MRIPIKEANNIAKKYGYAQVIILALKENNNKATYNGWRTTYNKDKNKCDFLGKIADILGFNLICFYNNEKVTEEYHKKIKEKRNEIN